MIDSINATANTTTCPTLCTTKLDSTFVDYRMVVVPTFYNDCQAIYADSCKSWRHAVLQCSAYNNRFAIDNIFINIIN